MFSDIRFTNLNIVVDIFCLCTIFLIMLTSLIANIKSGKKISLFFIMTWIVIFIIGADLIRCYYDGSGEKRLAFMYIVNLIGFTGSYMFPILYMHYIFIIVPNDNKYLNSIKRILDFVGAIFCIINIILIFTNNIFTYEEGIYTIQRFYNFTIFVPLVLDCFIFLFIIFSKYLYFRQKIAFGSYSILSIAAYTLQIIDHRFLCILFAAMTFSMFIILINIFISLGETTDIQTEKINEQQITIMMSQIKPHFIYNALSSIASLCLSDPKEAYETTIEFSSYLRCNLDSIGYQRPIAFFKELEHVEYYLKIEKRRFPDKLIVNYEIGCVDFMIPALTVEPLVENAVRCGIQKKLTPGTLTIQSFEKTNFYVVKIIDDGIGYDVNETKNDGRSHVGIKNVKYRLEKMVNGKLVIYSKIGEGTICTIVIPKNN